MKNKIFGVFSALVLLIMPIDNIYGNSSEDTKFIELTDFFCEDYFYHSGGLNQHFMIESPTKYNTRFTSDDEELDVLTFQLQSELESIKTEELSENNRYRYRMLRKFLESTTELDKFDEHLYEPLAANGGEQVNIVMMLSLYTFNNRTDIDNYLELLKTVPEYVDELLEFEDRRYEKGYYMTQENADNIAAFCKKLIESDDKNPLLTSFNRRLDEWDLVDSFIADELVAQNEEIVATIVIPAFEKIYEYVEEYGEDYVALPLGELENGAEYFEKYAQLQIGTSKDMLTMKSELQQEYSKIIKKLQAYSVDKDFSARYFDKDPEPVFSSDDLNEMTKWLIDKTNSSGMFPKLENITYNIEEIDSFFRNFMNPAFTVIPPVDNSEKFNIYSNGSSDITTVSHEVAPGHLWQLLYASRQGSLKIDRLLQTTGYAEGWAQQAEEHSSNFLYNDAEYANYLNLLNKALLYEAALADIFVNYEGLSEDALKQKNRGYGAYYYEIVFSQPCALLTYAMGQYSIDEMEAEASTYLGEKFSYLKFNRFILDNYYLDFDLLKERFYLEYLELDEIPKFPLTSGATDVPIAPIAPQTTTTTIPQSGKIAPSSTTKTVTTTAKLSLSSQDKLSSPLTGDNLVLVLCICGTAGLVVICGIFLLRHSRKD
jgi:uncharacterized protein (DUF885 family)